MEIFVEYCFYTAAVFIWFQDKGFLLFNMLIRFKPNILGTKAEVRMWM